MLHDFLKIHYEDCLSEQKPANSLILERWSAAVINESPLKMPRRSRVPLECKMGATASEVERGKIVPAIRSESGYEASAEFARAWQR